MKRIFPSSIIFFLLSVIIFEASSQTYNWSVALGGNLLNQGEAVETDLSGNVYLGGYRFRGEAYITSYDSAGQFRWQTDIGGVNQNRVTGLHVDDFGNLYAVGTYKGSLVVNTPSGLDTLRVAGSDQNIFVLAFDTTGNYKWGFGLNGPDSDVGSGITSDEHGNIYIVGSFTSSNEFDPGPGTFTLTSKRQDDCFIASYDPNGSFRWARPYGGIWTDLGFEVEVGENGWVYAIGGIVGSSDPEPIDSTAIIDGRDVNGFILAYDTLGNYQWAKSVGGSRNEFFRSLAIDKWGNLNISGSFGGIVDFDPGEGVFELEAEGSDEFFVARYNSIGEFIWANAMHGFQNEYGVSIAVDSLGDVYVAGQFQTEISPNPDDTSFVLINSHGTSCLLSSYDSLGQYKWAFLLRGNGRTMAISMDQYGGIFMTGAFQDSLAVDPADSTEILIGQGGSDAYLVKYTVNLDPTTSNDLDLYEGIPFTIYPNPTREAIHIKVQEDMNFPHKKIFYQIFDIHARSVSKEFLVTEFQTKHDITHLPQGMYIIRLRDQNGNMGRVTFIKK